MADKEKLQSMLDNLINQKPEDAQVDFHSYLQDRMQPMINPQVDIDDEAVADDEEQPTPNEE